MLKTCEKIYFSMDKVRVLLRISRLKNAIRRDKNLSLMHLTLLFHYCISIKLVSLIHGMLLLTFCSRCFLSFFHQNINLCPCGSFHYHFLSFIYTISLIPFYESMYTLPHINTRDTSMSPIHNPNFNPYIIITISNQKL